KRRQHEQRNRVRDEMTPSRVEERHGDDAPRSGRRPRLEPESQQTGKDPGEEKRGPDHGHGDDRDPEDTELPLQEALLLIAHLRPPSYLTSLRAVPLRSKVAEFRGGEKRTLEPGG